jgi:very-short-patch-repair endonuclease
MAAVSRTPQIPEPLAGRIFRGRDVVARGLLTNDALRTASTWRRQFQGIYVDAQVPITHHLRCAAAMRYLLPADAVIAGRSAAQLHGAAIGSSDDPVEILLPQPLRRRSPAGLLIHRGPISKSQVQKINGLPVTDPVRTCWDLSQWLDPVTAVMVIDQLLVAGPLFKLELDKHLSQTWGLQGWRAFAHVVSLADHGAESPPESELRVRLVLAGLPRPQVQYSVIVEGRFVARVDLGWPEFRVAVEYDGQWHGRPGQLHADRHRLNRLVSAGWLVLHVTSLRLRTDLDGIIAEVSAALASRQSA